jgi:cell division protein FtsW
MAFKFLKSGHRPDYFLIALILVLTISGLIILASASSVLGTQKFGDSYYYLKHQVINGLIIGLAAFFVASKVNYQVYKKLAIPLLLVSIAFLALVFTKFGVTAGGASRWVKIGPIGFQPSEILKLTFIIYLAAWLSNPKMSRTSDFLTGPLPFLIISGFVAAMLLLQPATSTIAIILASALVVYFLSGAQWKHIAAMAMLGIVAFGLVIYVTPYRLDRVKGFLNKSSDIEGSNFQLKQALMAIGSGRTWGVGYGNSVSKASYLPAPLDDSIFAIAAEELGFVGAGVLIVLFATLTFRIFWIAKNIRDKFGQMILIGFGTVIGLQSFVNIASISGMIPLTGVPLPFISYGGTALAVFLAMGGIVVNVSKYT